MFPDMQTVADLLARRSMWIVLGIGGAWLVAVAWWTYRLCREVRE